MEDGMSGVPGSQGGKGDPRTWVIDGSGVCSPTVACDCSVTASRYRRLSDTNSYISELFISVCPQSCILFQHTATSTLSLCVSPAHDAEAADEVLRAGRLFFISSKIYFLKVLIWKPAIGVWGVLTHRDTDIWAALILLASSLEK